jgi:hypothetical protein
MMKKTLLILALTVFCTSVYGQWLDCRISGGGGVAYGSLPDKIGIGINA